MLHVLLVGTKGWGQPARRDHVEYALDLVFAQDLFLVRLDEADVPAGDRDVGRDFLLQLGAADEHDDGLDRLPRQAEQFGQRLGVLVVLPEGVPEPIGALAELLRPLGIPLGAEDPAAHVLRLNDEHAIARDDHMVDLRGALA